MNNYFNDDPIAIIEYKNRISSEEGTVYELNQKIYDDINLVDSDKEHKYELDAEKTGGTVIENLLSLRIKKKISKV